ncbi:MAG: hypothetical protein AB1765_13100 [Candidatus Hydrogenedentota bacterium]
MVKIEISDIKIKKRKFIASKSEYEERIKICEACEYKMYTAGILRCQICKCIMPIKARLLMFHCLKQYW